MRGWMDIGYVGREGDSIQKVSRGQIQTRKLKKVCNTGVP